MFFVLLVLQYWAFVCWLLLLVAAGCWFQLPGSNITIILRVLYQYHSAYSRLVRWKNVIIVNFDCTNYEEVLLKYS